MYIGSLNNVLMESTYNYIDSIRLDDSDPIVRLGEVALHKTLEYEDTSYLWEYALDDTDEMIITTYTHKDNGRKYEESQKLYDKPGHYWVKGPENTEFYYGDNRLAFRRNVDDMLPGKSKMPNHRQDEKEYNYNKEKVLGELDDKLKRINNLSTEMQSIKSIQKEKNALEGFRDHIKNREFPKSWLAKKIAWFRSLYEKFMLKNKYAKDPGAIGWIKHVLACIAKIIDTLLAKLQHAVN